MFLRTILVVFCALVCVSTQSLNTVEEQPLALASPEQLVQCNNATIAWRGGQAPFKLTIKPQCSSQSSSGEEFLVSDPDATSTMLPIDYLAGTPVEISIFDSKNMLATTPPIIIQSSDADDTCKVRPACSSSSTPTPSAPILLATDASSSAMPTDHLVTSNSSAPTPVQAPTGSASPTMIVVYSYASRMSSTAAGSASEPSEMASNPNSNSAPSRNSASTVPIVLAGIVASSQLVFGP